MLTCSWSGSTAPGAKRISAVIRPVFGSIISVFTSQPGKRVGFHSMSAGLTRCECSSAKVCFGVTASMTILRLRLAFAHVLFGKPVPTFPGHALGFECRGGHDSGLGRG